MSLTGQKSANAELEPRLLFELESEQSEYLFEFEELNRGENYFLLALWRPGSRPQQHDVGVPLVEVISITGYAKDDLTFSYENTELHSDATVVCVFTALQDAPIEVAENESPQYSP